MTSHLLASLNLSVANRPDFPSIDFDFRFDTGISRNNPHSPPDSTVFNPPSDHYSAGMTRDTARLVSVLAMAFAFGAAAAVVDFPRFPSISPDGSSIVFSWRGDLWRVSSSGGQALRLTSHPADETNSAWSPDGSLIAFESDREGAANLYVMSPDGSGLRQVTDTDRSLTLSGFDPSPQSPGLLFDSSLEGDLYRSSRPYVAPLSGAPFHRLHDAFGSLPAADRTGQRIAFVRGGSAWSRRNYRGPDNRDLWLFNRADGSFRQLTTFAGNDSYPLWLDDHTIIFLSDRRLDRVNVYRMDLNAGESSASPLTSFDDRDIQHLSIAFHSPIAVFMAWDSLYTLKLDAPNPSPQRLSITAADDEQDNVQLKSINRDVSEAALSPDGKVVALVAYGEVFLRDVEDRSPTRRITNSPAREKNLAWSADGKRLFFVSDSDGTDSIYAAEVDTTLDDVRKQYQELFHPAAASQPAATAPAGEPAPAASAPESLEPPASQPQNAETDAKADAKEKKSKDKNESRWPRALTFRIAPVIAESTNDRNPSPSPDGKKLAFRRGPGDLMILNLESNATTALVTGWDSDLEWRWSADSRLIAYQQSDRNFNSDIFIVPADGSKPPVNITRHPDNDTNPRWSADGRVLAFLSERTNEEVDVWMVYLDKLLEALNRQELDQYFKDAADLAKKRKPLGAEPPKPEKKDDDKDEPKPWIKVSPEHPPETFDLEDAYLRVRRVTTFTGSESSLELTPAGDRFVINADDPDRSLFSMKWDGTDKKRLGGAAEVQHLSLTGDRVIQVAGGQASSVKIEGGDLKSFDIDHTIRIDLQEQAAQKFLEAARILGETFYHPTMKGLDWPALSVKYLDLARKTRTADEFNDVANRFLGELNASHLGVFAPGRSSPIAQPCGRLGTIHEPVNGGFRVIEVIPETPAAKGDMALLPGDIITAIDEVPFSPVDTVESRLRGRIGSDTILTIKRPLDGRDVEFRTILRPISYGQFVSLNYSHWQRQQLAKVTEWSNGRIGYAHIQGMDQGSLDEFERDLFAAADGKQGLIIDVRNNGGGWTADRLLSSIMTQPHAYTVPRGGDPSIHDGYPQDRLFIQRYALPINMLCNEKSFSNAEIISHAFKTLKRGTLVGQQTYGGVISTGGTRLIDGTSVRLPFRGWYLLDGTDMENNGAVPDLLVPQTPEDESKKLDAQLKAAVEDLLKRI